MKIKLIFTSIIVLAFSINTYALDVKFADSSWNNKKIPTGQQCQKFGGNNPSTPKLIVTGIPLGSDAIILEYSDRDSKKMNNGGHGMMRFTLSSQAIKVVIPSIPGHTFNIPSQFKIIEAHRSPGWDKAGAYMPPCSGGKGHAYYLTIKTVKGDMVTAKTIIEMGKY